MDTKELFEKYTDHEFELNLLKRARTASLILIVFSALVWIIDLNILPANPILTIIGDSTKISYYYFFIFLTFFLITSKNHKLNLIANITLGISGIIVLSGIFSFFGLFGFDQWMRFLCETQLFGLINILLPFFFIISVFLRKYENIMQILALTSMIIGFGGLLYYLGTPDMYSKSLHYLIFHMLSAATFTALPTKNGLFKPIGIKSDISKQTLSLITHILAGIVTIYCIIEILRPSITPIFSRVSIISTLASLTTIFGILLYYSRKWVKKDLESEILKNEAIELQQTIENVQSLSKIAIVNGSANNYNWTSEIFEILEMKPINGTINEDLVFNLTTPESRELISKKHEKASKNCKPGDIINFDTTLEIKTMKGNTKYIKCISHNFINTDFETRKINGIIEDITEEIIIKRNLVESFQNQTILLKEVHHRVKNNLQIILSLLNLELRFNREDYEDILKKTRTRISSMATIHEQVYNSSDVAHVDSENYIQLTLENLFSLYSSNINLNLDIENHEVWMDKAIPIGLIINELGLNTIKYAFNEDEIGNFYVKFRVNNNICELDVWDDGRGLPDDFNFETSKSLGFTIIQSLIKQLDGESALLDIPKGFGLKITFKNEL